MTRLRLAGVLLAFLAAKLAPAQVFEFPPDTRLVAANPPLAPECQTQAGEGFLRVHCPGPQPRRFRWERPGFEPREVVADHQDHVWLDAPSWNPAPIRLRLEPENLRLQARVFWWEEGQLQWAWPDQGGEVAASRTPPGTPYHLAVVGPGVQGVLLRGVRRPAEEPLFVVLEPGSSGVVVCLSPERKPLQRCELAVGEPPQLMRRQGLAQLQRKAPLAGEGGLFVIRSLPSEAWLQAQAPGFPPLLRPLLLRDDHLELEMPAPRTLEVFLRHARTWEPLAGAVRLVGLPLEVALAEVPTDSRGRAELLVGGEEIRVVAEASGFRPQSWQGQVTKPRDAVTLDLEPAKVLQGEVVDEAGTPLAGATVMALASGRFESAQNATSTDEAGRFEVLAPGDGPWELWVSAPGYAGTRLAVTRPESFVRVVLARDCTVLVSITDPRGTPVTLTRPLFLRPGEPLPRKPAASTAAGLLPVRLAPGEWQLIAEGEGVWTTFSVPAPCDGVVVPITAQRHTPRPEAPPSAPLP